MTRWPDSPGRAAATEARPGATPRDRARCAWTRLFERFGALPPALRLTLVTLVSLGLWGVILLGVVAAVA
jgi:hypothetical protein